MKHLSTKFDKFNESKVDIESIEFDKDDKDLKLTDHKLGCLMVGINKPSTLKDILSEIDESDILEEMGGIEDETHITVLYGTLDDECDFDEIIKDFEKEFPIKYDITGISLFSDDQRDVLKYDIESKQLNKLHEYLKDKYPNEYSFPSYESHSTIAFLKPGSGEKYLKDLEKESGETRELIYSRIINGKNRKFIVKY